MTKETKNNVRPEGCICEQFAYLPDSVSYPNSSDINKLSEIAGDTKSLKEVKVK